MAAILTGYKAGPDNAYKGHPDGGTDTSSGVKLNEKYATCAIPMEKGRTNLQVGDVILVENDGKKVAVWVTDVGGLPHGDIDLAKSDAVTKNLGINFKESENGKSVIALEGVGNVKVTKLANVKPGGLKNPDAVNEAILALNGRINSLQSADEIRSELANEVKDPKNLELADKEHENVIYNAPSKGGYRDRKRKTDGSYEDSFRDEEEYGNYLSQLFEENPILGMFLLLIGIMSGFLTGETLEQVLQAAGKATGRDPSDIADSIGDGSKQKTFTQAAVDAPDAWNKAWTGGAANNQDVLKGMVPDAVKNVQQSSDPNYSVYQEVKGTADKSYGVFVYKDKNNPNEIRCVPWVTGGAGKGSLPGASTGTGPGMVDPRYPDAKEIPDYTIEGYRTRNDALGNFSFDILSNGKDMIAGTGRGAMRVHVGSGSGLASLGCQHITDKDAGDFIEQNSSRKLTMHILPSLDQNNVLVQEIAKERPQQLQRTASVGSDSGQSVMPDAPSSKVTPVVYNGPTAQRFNSADTSIPDPGTLNSAKDAARKIDSSTSGIDLGKVGSRALQARIETLNAVDDFKKKLDPNKPIIVLDSGHGTSCGCGACNGLEDKGVREFSVNARAALEEKGYQVVDTNQLMPKSWGEGSETGKFERSVRAEVAERLGADQFISLHMDAGDKNQSGTTVYYFDDQQFANNIKDAMKGDWARRDTTTQHKELGVLRTYSERQGALVELMNLSNADDLATIQDPAKWAEWRKEKAAQLAEAIDKTYKDKKQLAQVEKEVVPVAGASAVSTAQASGNLSAKLQNELKSVTQHLLTEREGRTLEIPERIGQASGKRESKASDNQVTMFGVTGLDYDLAPKLGLGQMDKKQFEQYLIQFHAAHTDDQCLEFSSKAVMQKYLVDSGYQNLPPALMPMATDMAFNKGSSASNWALDNAARKLAGISEVTPNPGAEAGFPGFDDPAYVHASKFDQVAFNDAKANYDKGLSSAQMVRVNEQFKAHPKEFMEAFIAFRKEHHKKDVEFDKQIRSSGTPLEVEKEGQVMIVYGGKIDRSRFLKGWDNRADEVSLKDPVIKRFVEKQLEEEGGSAKLSKIDTVQTPEEAAKAAALAAVSGMKTQIIDADKAKAERAEKDEKKKADDVLASCQIDAEVKKNKDGYPPKPSVGKVESAKESAAALA